MTKQIKTIPKGWKKDKIGSYGYCVRGVSYKPSDLRHQIDDSSIPLLRSNNIKDNSLNLSDVQIVSKGKVSNEQILKKEDIFICMSNGSKALVGKNVFIENDSEYTIGAFCSLFHINQEKIVPSFVKQLFLSDFYKSQIADSLAGTSINNLKNSHIDNLRFLIPPFIEQKKIAEILGTVDNEIQKTDEIIEQAEKLKKGLMQELFTKGIGHKKFKKSKFGNIPQDWNIVNFSEIIKITNGQVDPRQEPYSRMTLLAPNHIESGSGRITEKVTANQQKAISGKYLVEKGDVVYSKIRPYLKKAVIADVPCICSADMYPIKGINGLINEYLFYILLSDHFTNFAESNSGRTGIPKINRQELENYKLPLPPVEEQQEIVKIFASLDEKSLVEHRSKEKLTHLKKGLMQDLLSGKVRV